MDMVQETGSISEFSNFEKQENTGEVQVKTGEEALTTGENTNARRVQGRFAKGQSGNRSGRPKGSRNKATLGMQALLEDNATAITKRVIDIATQYPHDSLMKVLFDRFMPLRKGAPVHFDLPAINSVADLAQAQISVFQAVAEGEISPQEGHILTGMADKILKTLEKAET